MDDFEEQEGWLTDEEAERINKRHEDNPLWERYAARSASDELETVRCLDCGAEICEGAPRCPACGAYYPEAGPQKYPPGSPHSTRWIWLTAILCILLILVVWIPEVWSFLHALIFNWLK
ncbi:MAG: hypothetical protein RDV41_12575 [Planctomycetota bacterium]|nr:hypothetical protein [Planctomycetota bacterium]